MNNSHLDYHHQNGNEYLTTATPPSYVPQNDAKYFHELNTTSNNNNIQQTGMFQMQNEMVDYNNNNLMQHNYQNHNQIHNSLPINRNQYQTYYNEQNSFNSDLTKNQFNFGSSTNPTPLSSNTSTPNLMPSKKELITHEHDCDEFDDDEDDEDEEEDEEDDEESDDDFSDEDENKTSGNKGNKKSKSKRIMNQENDPENDYEIKYNCLTEEGVHLNTLFNSPSSLSSSQSNKSLTLLTNKNETNKLVAINNDVKKPNTAVKNGNKKTNSKANSKTKNLVTKSEMVDQNELARFNYNPTSNSSAALFQQQLDQNGNPYMASQKALMINSYIATGIMNDYELVNLPLRELNKRLRALPKHLAYGMKKRRRTLKNRKYAQNCRSKRLEQKSEMEIQNAQLKIEIGHLRKLVEKLQQENQHLINNNNNNNSSNNNSNVNKSMISSTNNNQLKSNEYANINNNSNSTAGSQLVQLLTSPFNTQ